MSMVVAVGSDVTFSVTATSEDNVLMYQWLRNSGNVGNIDSATNSTFQIMSATADVDIGVYSVEVSNSLLLSTTSSAVRLIVGKWVNYMFKLTPCSVDLYTLFVNRSL